MKDGRFEVGDCVLCIETYGPADKPLIEKGKRYTVSGFEAHHRPEFGYDWISLQPTDITGPKYATNKFVPAGTTVARESDPARPHDAPGRASDGGGTGDGLTDLEAIAMADIARTKTPADRFGAVQYALARGAITRERALE